MDKKKMGTLTVPAFNKIIGIVFLIVWVASGILLVLFANAVTPQTHSVVADLPDSVNEQAQTILQGSPSPEIPKVGCIGGCSKPALEFVRTRDVQFFSDYMIEMTGFAYQTGNMGITLYGIREGAPAIQLYINTGFRLFMAPEKIELRGNRLVVDYSKDVEFQLPALGFLGGVVLAVLSLLPMDSWLKRRFFIQKTA